MTKEQSKLSTRNKHIAAKQMNVEKGYVLHHIDPYMKENDLERYIQWNIEDLVKMKKEDHVSLHWTINKESRVEKMSKSHSNLKGKYSDHHKMMMSINHKGCYAPQLSEEEAIERYLRIKDEKEKRNRRRELKPYYHLYVSQLESQSKVLTKSIRDHKELLSDPHISKDERVEIEMELAKYRRLLRAINYTKHISFKDWLDNEADEFKEDIDEIENEKLTNLEGLNVIGTQMSANERV